MNDLIEMEEPDPPQEDYEEWLHYLEQDKLKTLDTHLNINLQELNMRIGEMKESKFLKKEDVGQGMLVTIARLEQQNVAMEDQPPENKWIMYFHETDKGVVLNWTNIQLVAKALGSEETNDWIGKKIVLYEDPNVSFGGKLVGGIRVRAMRTQAASEPPKAAPAFDDEIPF